MSCYNCVFCWQHLPKPHKHRDVSIYYCTWHRREVSGHKEDSCVVPRFSYEEIRQEAPEYTYFRDTCRKAAQLKRRKEAKSL